MILLIAFSSKTLQRKQNKYKLNTGARYLDSTVVASHCPHKSCLRESLTMINTVYAT